MLPLQYVVQERGYNTPSKGRQNGVPLSALKGRSNEEITEYERMRVFPRHPDELGDVSGCILVHLAALRATVNT